MVKDVQEEKLGDFNYRNRTGLGRFFYFSFEFIQIHTRFDVCGIGYFEYFRTGLLADPARDAPVEDLNLGNRHLISPPKDSLPLSPEKREGKG
jgi:hypothetical protein